MKEKNILIVARPDHSLFVYEALTKQEKITYSLLTFKVFPAWMRLFIKSPKAYFVKNNVIISWWWTLVNLTKYKVPFSICKKISEKNLMSKKVSRLLDRSHFDIVYYWPHYCHKGIEEYANKHPQSLYLADVHLPNPQVVYETMIPVYKKYGINPETTILYHHSKNTLDVIKNAPAIMTPSQYVVDTYKNVLPHKKFYVIGYGITVSKDYQKRYRSKIQNFVYAGGSITLEKGCDLLCEFFSNHPELNLHLYGETPSDQMFIFDAYLNCNNIVFHGLQPKKKLQEEIKQYDVGIHLSRFDAYSLSVGEILGSGLPCIVSTSTGICFDMEKYALGIGCELDLESVGRAVKSMINADTYNQYVDNINLYIQKYHKSYGEKMVDFIDTCLNHN